MTRYLILFSLISLISCSDKNDEIKPTPRKSNVVGLINDEVGDKPVVIYANAEKRILIAFQRQVSNTSELLKFELSESGFPIILRDQNGNEYDVGGNSVGSTLDRSLMPVNQVVGYWFFFPSFFQELHMYDGQTLTNPNYQSGSDEWLVDTDFVFSGSFRDGIPSIDEPILEKLDGKALIENTFYSELEKEELVIVIKSGNQNYVYPHRILEYHEVLNDNINGQPIVISYCPLTGTSKAWSRNILNKEVEFGVSGLLYNNNLILYDRTSETLWSQILSIGINGDYISEEASSLMIIETSIGSVRSLQGESYYLSSQTGFNFDYSESLYDIYKSDNRVSFPLTFRNEMLHPKERVLGIPDGNDIKVYRFDDFD